MTADLKPYPAMKDCGVPWLGGVPENWEVRQLGRFGRLFKGNGGTKEDEVPTGIPCIRYGDLYTEHRYSIERSRARISAERVSAYTSIQYGDILFAASGETIEEIGKSAVNLIGSRAYCGGDILLFRPATSVNARFMGYACDCPQAVAQKSLMGRGFTVMHIYSNQLKRLWIALPPLPEQVAIVRFLDHADQRIRRYIRTKHKLIKLLQEQKQAIIHRGVTRGLNPNARLKPSGVDWLPSIPEDWAATRLKFIASNIVDCLHATPIYSEDGVYPAIRTADVTPGALRLSTARRVDEEHYRQWVDRMVPVGGDILYTREGERFGIAALVPPDVQLCISQRMMVFRIHSIHNSAYIMWQINCQHVYGQAACDLIGSAAPHVNVERIKNFWLLTPPRSEQDEIVAGLEDETADINAALQHARDEIRLIREYRTRLIADVVTGKLDVRAAAAKLPHEIKEQDELGVDVTLEGGDEAGLAPGDLADKEVVE